ncbi:MAG: hypothetical protein ACR2RL_05050, partial [Gammaproteobacteria bacterium]
PVLIGFGSVDALRGAGSSAAQRRYCSPELRTGGVADRMSDICALGICFYDMLTGAEADEGEGPWPPALPEALSGFAQLVEAMTAEDPHDRLQSADRVAEWALGLRNGTSSSPAAAAGESTDPVLLEGGGASTFGDDALEAVSVVTTGRPAPGLADGQRAPGIAERAGATSEGDDWFSAPPRHRSVVEQIDSRDSFDALAPEIDISALRASATEVDFDVGVAASGGATSSAGWAEQSDGRQTVDFDLGEYVSDGERSIELDVDLGRAFSALDGGPANSPAIDLADLEIGAPDPNLSRDRQGSSDSRFDWPRGHGGPSGVGPGASGGVGTGTVATNALDAETLDAALASGRFEAANAYSRRKNRAGASARFRHPSPHAWFSRLTIGGLVALLLGFGWAAYQGLVRDDSPGTTGVPAEPAENTRPAGTAPLSPARTFASDRGDAPGAASGTVSPGTPQEGVHPVGGQVDGGQADRAASNSSTEALAGRSPSAAGQVDSGSGPAGAGAVVVPRTEIRPLAPVTVPGDDAPASGPAVSSGQVAPPSGEGSDVATVIPAPTSTTQAADSNAPGTAGDIAEVTRLLELGRQSLSQNKLTTPEGESAFRYYRDAIRLQPDSPGAVQLRRDIAARYVVLANSQWKRGQYASSQSLARRGLVVSPGDARLAEILTRALPEEEPSVSDVSTEPVEPSGQNGDSSRSSPGFGSSLRRYLDRFQPLPPDRRAVPRSDR